MGSQMARKSTNTVARCLAAFALFLIVGCKIEEDPVKTDAKTDKKAEVRENKTDENQASLEYSLIFKQLLEKDRSVLELTEKTYPKIIKEYKDFIKKYPNSRLVDDAKLRIAEFYNIWGTAGSDDLLERKTRATENWRKEANRWLLDVVENHPDDKAVSYPKTEETGEYTASYALYFLYAWGAPKDKKYLEMLVQKYPASEAAGWAKEILSRK